MEIDLVHPTCSVQCTFSPGLQQRWQFDWPPIECLWVANLDLLQSFDRSALAGLAKGPRKGKGNSWWSTWDPITPFTQGMNTCEFAMFAISKRRMIFPQPCESSMNGARALKYLNFRFVVYPRTPNAHLCLPEPTFEPERNQTLSQRQRWFWKPSYGWGCCSCQRPAGCLIRNIFQYWWCFRHASVHGQYMARFVNLDID